MGKNSISASLIESSVTPRFWMTRESAMRMSKGGNNKGAVPVHGKKSVISNIPLYDQAALDAAIFAEREACAKACEDFNFKKREEIAPPRTLPRYLAAAIRARQ